MDRRKWMYNVERVTPEYINGLSEFIKTAEDHQVKTGKARISCPCKECAHFICHDDIETIRYHLFKHGFTNNYTWWKHHGEARLDCNDVVLESNVNNNDDNCGSSNQNINDMLHDAEHNAELDMEKLQQLFVESEKPLYAGCTNFTKLSAVLQLLTVKAEYGLSDVEKKTKEDYYLVSQVERVVGPLSWELPIVNLQEDIWECGFYVMKWVLDFVLKYQHDDFPNI
ncbi:ulp1 protease family, C-terminal catalytic domain-containing protein, partial [Tanacetum coccineum]